MAVRVNKSAFNIREKLNELTKRFGLKGSELAAAETVQDARDLVSAGRKNIIINGDMKVCQRFPLNSANNINNATHTYHVDRFKAYNGNSGILQGEWVNTQIPEGFRYSLKYTPATVNSSTAGSDLSFISYVVEEKDFERFRWGTSNAQQLTLSFKVKTNKTGIYCVSFFNANTFNRGFVVEVPITNTSWNDIKITIPGDTSGTWSMLRINWCLAIGTGGHTTANAWVGANYSTSNQVNFMDNTANEFYLTGVQLEVGKNATEFEHRSYGEELALCQRYFQRYTATSNPIFPVVTGGLFGLNVPSPVEMRDSPNITLDATNCQTRYWDTTDWTSRTGVSYISGGSAQLGTLYMGGINTISASYKGGLIRNLVIDFSSEL